MWKINLGWKRKGQQLDSQIMGGFEGKYVCRRVCAKEYKREDSKRKCEGSIYFGL
jgi:hypothetical protein